MAGATRAHVVARAGALAAALVVVPIALVVAAPPASAAPLQTACPAGTLAGTTYTLTADCAVTEPLTVPDGVTLDGGGFTISATDAGGPQWNGAIITNAGASMNIQNVTVTGPTGGFQLCVNSGFLLYGIWFNDASGTVNNVTVDHIYQQQNGAFASCGTGRAIRADGLTGSRTVRITNTTAADYQKTAFQGFGPTMTLRGDREHGGTTAPAGRIHRPERSDVPGRHQRRGREQHDPRQ